MLGDFLELKELVKSFSVAVRMLVDPEETIERSPDVVTRSELVMLVSLFELMEMFWKFRDEAMIVSFIDSCR